MAALVGCGVHNALIEIDGPEVPLLDGSSAPFVSAILARGVQQLDAPVRAIRVLKPVTVAHGDATASLTPSDELSIDFEIDFADAAIGHQEKSLNMANGAFVRELCDSRTFCRKSDIDLMRERGLIAGASLTSAVVVDGTDVVTPGGPAPLGRAGSSQDAGCTGRSGLGRCACSWSLCRHARRACHDEQASSGLVRRSDGL